MQFDPIADRKSNAHMLILGPTGSGKSAMLVYDLLMVMAVHRPRVFIIEAGGSFSLLGQYFASLGLVVNQVTMRPGEDVSLPPFADALKLPKTHMERMSDETQEVEGEGSEDAMDAGRDLLGEMEISARLMITGGDAHEDARLTRADRWLIQQAILVAVGQVRASGRSQVLTEDVAHALLAMATERPRAKDMADALGHFCTPGSLAAHFFNRPGKLWPDADVTIFEMGVLAKDGYEDKLAVAYVSLMNHIHALVERCQYEGRPTIVLTDEGHLITTNPLLAPYVVMTPKMLRKLRGLFARPRHAGLPRLCQAHAQHDGMVEVPVHAAGGGRADRPLPRVERRGTRPVAGGGQRTRQVHRGRDLGAWAESPVPQRPARPRAGLGDDRAARKGRTRPHHERTQLPGT